MVLINKISDYGVSMNDKSKIHNISIRLNDEFNEKLENYANSHDSQKSTVAADIIVNALNENLEELMVNHISYPRPVMKKLFSRLNEDQLRLIIADFNHYNKGILKSASQDHSSQHILDLLRKWFRRSGCEVRFSSFDCKKILEIHHELEKNWSIVTCATTSFILGILDYKIELTFVDDNWFKIEYSEK